jgi:hypothetical protein
MGIPYRHDIKRKLNLGLILEINDFDSQWVLKHISLEHIESSLNPVERDYVQRFQGLPRDIRENTLKTLAVEERIIVVPIISKYSW